MGRTKVRMSKLLVVFLLMLFFSLSCARRLTPWLSSSTVKTQLQWGGDEVAVVEESCEGVSEEDCLERRTLQAHTDYIYTQKEIP